MNYTNPDGNADFLGGITRVPRLDAATRAALTAQGVDVNAIDPPGTTATTTAGGHKIYTFGPALLVAKAQTSVCATHIPNP
jgi:hypothetical protein